MYSNAPIAGIGIVTMALLAAACGSFSYYVQPPAEGNALLELSLAEKAVFQMFRDGRDCSGGLVYLRDESPYTRGNAANRGEPLVIVANKELAFEIDDTIYSFFPEPQGRYRAEVDELVIEKKVSFMTQKHSIWTVRVTRLVSDGSTPKWTTEPSFRERARRGTIVSVNEANCRPL